MQNQAEEAYCRRPNSKLIALSPHVLHEDGDVQCSPPTDNEGIGCVTGLHSESKVPLQLTLQALLEVATGHKLALLAGKGRCVDQEGHAYGGLLHLQVQSIVHD